MTTIQKIEEAKDAIGNVLHNHRSYYVNGMSLRHLYQEKEKQFIFAIGEHPAPEPLKVLNCLAHMHQLVTSPVGEDFGTVKSLLALSEESAEFQESYAILQPLIDEVARLEAIHADEVLAAAEVAQARRDAFEAAKADALAKIEAEFAEPEPEAPQEPAPPFRGKGIKPALATA